MGKHYLILTKKNIFLGSIEITNIYPTDFNYVVLSNNRENRTLLNTTIFSKIEYFDGFRFYEINNYDPKDWESLRQGRIYLIINSNCDYMGIIKITSFIGNIRFEYDTLTINKEYLTSFESEKLATQEYFNQFYFYEINDPDMQNKDIIQEAINNNKDKNIILVSFKDRENYVIIKKEFREKYKNIGIIQQLCSDGIHRYCTDSSAPTWKYTSDDWTSTLFIRNSKNEVIKMIEGTLKKIENMKEIENMEKIEIMSW